MPVASTMPNMTIPAPPSTKGGMEATSTDILGTRPKASRIPPDMTQTQRLDTPVTLTSPMFWEKEV